MQKMDHFSLEKLQGKIVSLRGLSKTEVQIEVENIKYVIELSSEKNWVLNIGDHVCLVGEVDKETGVFNAYAYFNQSKRVYGNQPDLTHVGYCFVVATVVFFWAIFPLFFHLPIGLKSIRQGKKIKESINILSKSQFTS